MTDRNQQEKLKLVWCSPHPNHYNSYLFEHLAAIPDIMFEAVYFHKILAKYPWKSSFEGSYTIYYLKKFLGIDFGFLWRRRKRKQELFIVAGWNEPTMILFLICLMITGRTFVLFSDTPRIRETRGLRESLRKQVLDKIFKKMFRLLVTGTPGMEKARMLGIQERKLVNFPFATNTEFFVPKRERSSSNSGPLMIISSGRLDNAHKGYDIGIQALARLKKNHPQLAFRYVLAGKGPDQALLNQLIQENDLTEQVTLLGWLEPKDLLSFYHSGDVFLHPSHEDPFPNAVLEAMACGLPVVGSDAAGSVIDRIIHRKNGYVHRDGDVEDLYLKLVEVMQLSALELEQMSHLARETSMQWHVSYHQQVIKKMIEEYRQQL